MKSAWKQRIFFLIASAVILISGMFSYNKYKSPVVLEFGMFVGSNWGVETANSYIIIDKAIEIFEKEYPNVKINYESGIRKEDYSEWFSRKLLEGKSPDVFMMISSDINLFASLNVLKDLDEMIMNDNTIEKKNFFKTGLKAGNRFGTQYALPYELVPKLMFVNKTLLLKEGIQVPEYDWTWDEFYDICNAVTKDTDGNGSVDQFGAYNYNWKNVVTSNEVNLFDTMGKNPNFIDDRVVEAVQFSKTIYDLNQGQKVTQEDFDNGKVAFMPLSFAEYRTYKTYPYKIKKYQNFMWDCITLPAGESGGNISEVDALCIGIGKDTKYPELAWKFLKLLTYDEEIQMDIYRYSQGASALKSVTGSSEIYDILSEDLEEGEKVIDGELLFDVLENGLVVPQFDKYNDVIAIAENEINKAFEQDKSIERTLKYVHRSIENYLSK